MIGIEIKRMLKDGSVIFVVLMALVIGMMVTDKDAYLAPAVEIFLLLYASFTGWSMFERERYEGGMEYILSLPVSRTRLFFIKFLPRFISVGLILLIYCVLHSRFQFPSVLSAADFAIFYSIFFFISLSLSLSIKSFIVAFLLTSALSGGFTILDRMVDINTSDWSVFLQANAPLLVFPLLFFIAFHRYDLRPISSFNFRFALPAAGCCLIAAGLIYFLPRAEWCQYFFMGDGSIFRISCGQSQLIKDDGGTVTVQQRFPGCYIPIAEKDRFLYVQKHIMTFTEETVDSIDQLNLRTGRGRSIAGLPPGYYIMGAVPGDAGIQYGDKIYLLLAGIKTYDLRIMILDVKTHVSDLIPLTGISEGNKSQFLFLANIQTKTGRSWIGSPDTLYRVDSLGKCEKVLGYNFLWIWKSRFLVVTGDRMTVYGISDTLTPLYEKKGDFRVARRKFGSIYSKHALIREGSKFNFFNLEDFSMEEIPIRNNPYFYFEKGYKYCMVWVRGDEISVGEYRAGKLTMKKTWNTLIQGRRIIRCYTTGMVIYNSKQFESYKFE